MKTVGAVFLLLTPSLVNAAVTINEVAWMGSVDSANFEWIELYNSGGTAVDLTNWELSDGMKLNILLSGSIAADSFAVLERTSEDSAPGAAFLLYTGALVNTGATLTLKRSDGSLEDQVAGGDNWENIGGDNETKETAQYSSTGWLTGGATPGRKNITTESIKDTSAGSTKSSSGSSAKSVSAVSPSETVKLELPDVTLQLAVTSQSTGYVNQSIDFSVEGSGIGETLLDSLTYEWNFGDGLIASGKKSSHTFSYPGTYVVTVYGSYKRQEQAARHEITILPISISLTRNREGDIQINNDSPYEIDISKYRVTAGKDFVFPSRSILLPNQTVTIPLKKIGFGSVSVHDALNERVVFESNKPTVITVSNIASTILTQTSARSKDASKVLNKESILNEETVPTNTVIGPEKITSSSSPEASVPDNSLPYLGLIGVIAVGMLGLFKKPERNYID